ncbi:VTC domain-containing protein [Candidatus Pseudothioglobus singularis]|nr:VTC domain-containing protein [Candidatus Pseudothioglobus singularis]
MRNEIKFKGPYIELKTYLDNLKAFHSFPSRNVNSIYFDTPDLDFFIDSEEGTVPRKKIRYRWYDSREISQNGAIEIKKTNATLREKDSIKITNLDFDKITKISENIYGISLTPVVKVSYRRDYFLDIKGNRYTLDYNIEYFSLFDSKLQKIKSKSFEKYSILEVKTELDVDQDLLVTDFGDRRVRHSKYCEAIKNCHI